MRYNTIIKYMHIVIRQILNIEIANISIFQNVFECSNSKIISTINLKYVISLKTIPKLPSLLKDNKNLVKT